MDSNLQKQYLNTIKRLALEKSKSDILFESKIVEAIRNLSFLGLEVSKENILKDIEIELNNRRMENTSISVQSQIDQLKNNLDDLFEVPRSLEQKVTNETGSIPREPAMESPKDNLYQVNNNLTKPPIHSELEKQEIKDNFQKAQEEMKQKIEWAKQQSISPKQSEFIKEENNIQVQKEQSLEEIYDLEIQKLVELKKNNDTNYEAELNHVISKISTLTDRISNVRNQIESDVEYETKHR